MTGTGRFSSSTPFIHGDLTGRKSPDAPVLYETVWVDEDGTIEFREDIYGHDARQERILPASPIPGAIQVAQEHPGREARATPEPVRATF
jgi:hypothetical protein